MGSPHEEPKRDFAKMLDLDRTTLTKSMVERMERCLRDAEAARDALKAVIADCKEREFGKRDIEAMGKIAKLRLDDKRAQAQEQLEAYSGSVERLGLTCSIGPRPNIDPWSRRARHELIPCPFPNRS